MTELPARTAIIAHDAGAANMIMAWADAGMVPCDRAFLAGPAAALWDAGQRPPRLDSMVEALAGAEGLVTGTGWDSDLEHAARRRAREQGVHSIAVIDHWVNYSERFERRGETVLPDEIWVGDHHAELLAVRTFPGTPVRRLPNLYLDTEVARIPPSDSSGAAREVLYVLEPARSDWGRNTPGEFQALDHFVEHAHVLGLADTVTLRLRPHPSDPPGKYDEWIRRHPHFGAVLDDRGPLSAAIARADIVAGCNSFGLVVAMAAGRRTVCALPGWAPQCVLPHIELVHLKDLARPRS